jgi:hypothetical protein
MKLGAIAAAVLAFALATPASAQNRPFDPREYQRQVVGEPTQVLVLATMHLSGTPEDFDPAVLEPLLDRLAAFNPDAITIEALPGRQIDNMWEYQASYDGVARQYGGRATLMAAAASVGIGLDMPAAEAELRRTLAAWPASPTAAERRRLAALFGASGDPISAVVQWWRLAPEERVADDNVSRALVEQLATYETPMRRNENQLIGARLAVRLGLERIYPTDDQTDEIQSPTWVEDYTAFVSEPWRQQLGRDPAFEPLMNAPQRLRTAEEALATYRMLNTPRAGRTDSDGQWLTLMTRPSTNDAGRARVASWETRNLRQIANIREVTANYPGGRVLVIVGSAHKPWFDAYLRMMSDVEVVDAERVLR